MELTPLGFALFFAVPLLLGTGILRCLGLGPRSDRLAYWGWVWMSGALAVGALEGLRLLAGLGSPWPLLGLASFATTGLWLRARGTPLLVGEPSACPPSGRLERLVFASALAFVLLLTVHRMLSSSLSAVVADDEANFWSMRAKVLFESASFGGSYAQALENRSFNNANYPLLNSLLQLWVFDCAGRITHMANRLPIQLCSVALILCSASALRRACRPWIASVLLILLVTCAPYGAALRRANADVMVAFGALVAADVWLRARNRPSTTWVGLGSLALAFLLWSKREGMLLLAAAAMALTFLAWRQGRLRRPSIPHRALPWLAVPFAVQLLTLAHNALLGARGSHELSLQVLARAGTNLDDLPGVLAYLGELSFRPGVNAIPGLFFALALFMPRPLKGALSFLPLTCLLFLAGLAVAIQSNAQYLLHTASMRVVAQLLPLQILWIALTAEELLRARKPQPAEKAPPQPAADLEGHSRAA